MSHFIKLNILTGHWQKILRLPTHGKGISKERRNQGPNEVVRLPLGADMYEDVLQLSEIVWLAVRLR